MGNPFKKVPPPQNPEEFAKTYVLGRTEIKDARNAVTKSHKKLVAAETAINGSTESVSKEMKTALKEASRDFNKATSQLGYAHGNIGSSIKGMCVSFAKTLGINTDKLISTKVSGGSEAALREAQQIKGSIVGRIVSKPFRVAANHAGPTMLIGGLLAVVGIGSAWQKNRERKTQRAIEASLLEQPAPFLLQDQLPITAQAPMSYMNSVPPDQSQMLAAQLRGNGAPGAGHADGIMAARAAAQQASQQGTPVVPAV